MGEDNPQKEKRYILMKKILCALLAAIMLLSLCACAAQQEEQEPAGGDTTQATQTENETTAETTVETTVPETTAHEHKYTEKVTKEATCSAKGEKTLTCACGETKKEEIKTLDHTYSKATCTKPKTCKVCGKTSGDKASHKYVNGKCSVCGGSQKNYTEITAGYWRAYVVLDKNEMEEMTICFDKTGGEFYVVIYNPESMMVDANMVKIDGKKWYEAGFGYGAEYMTFTDSDDGNTVTAEIEGRGQKGTVTLERSAGNKLKVKSVKGTIIDSTITKCLKKAEFKFVG